jgi:Fe-S cluster biosynthesis and repair protein YggX
MAPEITCSRCGETRAATSSRIPFRSPLREETQAKICESCWQEWQQEQVRVINELALNLGDPRSHDLIELNARQFLNLEESA